MLALVLSTALVGATQFVSATSAVVREAPREDARAVTRVDLGTPVEVAAVRDGWARVVVGPRVLRFDAMDGEAAFVAPLTFDPRAPAGFVRAAELAPTAPSRRALLAAGETLRAWALDPHDREVARVPRPLTRSRDRPPAERADLVFGCSGDLARAVVVGGTVARLGAARAPALGDVCVAGLDVRAPCDGQRDHKAAMARVVPRFGAHGPALRLVVGPSASERPVWIVTRTVAVDGCSGCAPTASTRDVRAVRLRVPRVEQGTATLHVLVPRATGVIYDVVSADSVDELALASESLELSEDLASFSGDPRDDPGAGNHVYAAPDVCGCTCEESEDPDM